MAFVFLLVLFIGLSACDGGSSGDDEFKEAVVVNDLVITAITISSPNTIDKIDATIAVDSTEDFIATAEINSGNSEALLINDKVTWSSSDSSIISISSSGRATALTDGTVEIRAELADLVGSVSLSASSAELTGIAITIEGELADIGICTLHQKVTAIGTFEDDDNREDNVTAGVTWKSSDESIIEISNERGSEGGMTALRVGDVSITAENDDGTVVSNEWILSVVDTLDTITVTPDILTLFEGGDQQFKAMGSYSDLTEDQDITTTVEWKAQNSDASTAEHLSISNEDTEEGLATALADGDAQVTATCGDDVSASVSVTVEDAVVISGIEINDDSDNAEADLGVDQSIQLKAVLLFSDGSTQDVTDDSSINWRIDSGSAVVDESTGKVTFTEIGSSEIRVTYTDSDEIGHSDTIIVDIN